MPLNHYDLFWNVVMLFINIYQFYIFFLETTSVIDSTSSPEITTTHSKTSIVPITTEADLLQTTSYISITSSHEITTTNPKTTEGRTATETDLFGTTSAHLSTKTETTVESSTSNSAKSLAPKVSSTLSSGIVTNSTEHCNYVFVCSNHVNKIQDSQRFIYTVDTKQLSSYKRKRQSAWDPRKSSLYIGTVGIAVLVLTILLIMFLDCVPTKVWLSYILQIEEWEHVENYKSRISMFLLWRFKPMYYIIYWVYVN